jgi:hypothetical protein
MTMNKYFVALGLTPLFTLAAEQTSAPAEHAWVAPQSPEVQQLTAVLAGEWKTTEKFGPNENGAAGAGTFSIRKGPGGNSLIVDYTSQSKMGPYSSSRIIYWDGKEGHYRGFYCDSLQPVGCGEVGTGAWEGKDLVFESTSRGPNGPLQMRQRFSRISAASFTFSIDIINQGEPQRTLTIQALRSAAKP